MMSSFLGDWCGNRSTVTCRGVAYPRWAGRARPVMTTDTLSVHQDHNAVRPHSLGPPQIDSGPFGAWQSYRQSAANSDDVEERLCELQIIADQSFKVSLV